MALGMRTHRTRVAWFSSQVLLVLRSPVAAVPVCEACGGSPRRGWGEPSLHLEKVRTEQAELLYVPPARQAKVQKPSV